jgi:hypothetical protein
MQIRNNNPLDLTGVDGEQITVRAVSKLAGDTVSYALDGEKGGILPDPFTFHLDKAEHDPSVLTLVFTFVGAGGRFDVTVTGSDNGPESFFTFNQFGVPAGSISYTFDVV